MVQICPLADRIPLSERNSLQEEFHLRYTCHTQLCPLAEKSKAQHRLQQLSTQPCTEVISPEPESHRLL